MERTQTARHRRGADQFEARAHHRLDKVDVLGSEVLALDLFVAHELRPAASIIDLRVSTSAL